MHAAIETETDRTVTVRVRDNDDAVHRLTVADDGTVDQHHCPEYPNQGDRTPRVAERVEQARRFAKHVCWRYRGTDAIDPYSAVDRIANPDRLATTALVLTAMQAETLAETLAPVYEQVAGPDADGPVDPPTTAPDATCHRVEQDLALSLPGNEIRRLGRALTRMDGFSTLRRGLDQVPDRRDDDCFERLDGLLAGSDRDDWTDFLAEQSGTRVHWRIDGHTRVDYGPGPDSLERRVVDARLQVPAAESHVRTPADFQRHLLDHLRCQLRDCYVGMGVAPPGDVRVRGPGIDSFGTLYESADYYQRYHDPEAVVDWTRQPPVQFRG